MLTALCSGGPVPALHHPVAQKRACSGAVSQASSALSPLWFINFFLLSLCMLSCMFVFYVVRPPVSWAFKCKSGSCMVFACSWERVHQVITAKRDILPKNTVDPLKGPEPKAVSTSWRWARQWRADKMRRAAPRRLILSRPVSSRLLLTAESFSQANGNSGAQVLIRLTFCTCNAKLVGRWLTHDLVLWYSYGIVPSRSAWCHEHHTAVARQWCSIIG